MATDHILALLLRERNKIEKAIEALQLHDVVILDLRTPEEYQSDGAKIPGAIWFDRKELEERHLEILGIAM
jgi:rhodanese-related sulfurtransferase